MSELNAKLRAKLDVDEDIEPHLWTAMEAALDESEALAWRAIQLLDDLARDEKETKANVSARPRLSYETFYGDINQFPTFQANQRELFRQFQDKSALDGGATQQLYQLSKILSPDLANTVLSFSGAERGAEKAVDWLNLRFNSPGLMIPRIYDEIKNLAPAKNIGDVPRAAERVL